MSYSPALLFSDCCELTTASLLAFQRLVSADILALVVTVLLSHNAAFVFAQHGPQPNPAPSCLKVCPDAPTCSPSAHVYFEQLY